MNFLTYSYVNRVTGFNIIDQQKKIFTWLHKWSSASYSLLFLAGSVSVVSALLFISENVATMKFIQSTHMRAVWSAHSLWSVMQHVKQMYKVLNNA